MRVSIVRHPLVLLVLLVLCVACQTNDTVTATFEQTEAPLSRPTDLEQEPIDMIQPNSVPELVSQQEIDAVPPGPTTNLASQRMEIVFKRNDDIWATDPNGAEARIISKGVTGLWWSPDDRRVAICREAELYIANVNGSEYSEPDSELVFSDHDSIGFRPCLWLSNDLVLIQIWLDGLWSQVSYVDVNQGTAQKADAGEWAIIEAVSPERNLWVQRSAGGLWVVDTMDNQEPILQEFDVTLSDDILRDPAIAFSPEGDSIVFIGHPKDDQGSIWQIYSAEISSQGISSLDPVYSPKEFRSIQSPRLAPDGQHLAFIFDQMNLHILNMDDHEVKHSWPFEERLPPSYFLWSPDSAAVVYAYHNEQTGFFGLKRMNVETGETTIVTDGTFPAYESPLAWQWARDN